MKTALRVDTASFGATYTGAAFGLEDLDGYSVCASWVGGGSPVGILKLQACNNAFANNTGLQEDPNAVWVDITGSAYNVTTDGTYFYNVSDAYYKAFRIVYTRTSGTATATLYLNAKGIQ